MTLKQKFQNLKELNDEEKMKSFFEKYKVIFEMPATLIGLEISKEIKEQNPTFKVSPLHKIEGNLYKMAQEDRSLLYKNTISLTITINDDGKFQYIKLFEGLSADNEKDFIYGHYIVDISSLLLRDDLPYSEIIHKACWSAVTKNLKNIVENNNIKDL